MSFILAVHVPIAGLALIPVFLKWPLILMPVHVVFLEGHHRPGLYRRAGAYAAANAYSRRIAFAVAPLDAELLPGG